MIEWPLEKLFLTNPRKQMGSSDLIQNNVINYGSANSLLAFIQK